MSCAPNQYAREWRGNETLGTERTPMVLVMGLFTNDRILLQFSQALASWERFLLTPQTWALFQTDEALANFTAAQAASALSLHGRNWCGLPPRLADAGYQIYLTKKRQNILMLGRSIASWPPYGREPRHVTSGELILAWKWVVHAVHSIEALDFFDFWLKIDSDVSFQHPAPFLEQMTTRGARFMHTMIRKENPGMAQDLLNCTAAYIATAGCAHLQPEAMPDKDTVFYGNVIGGWLGLWQSPQALTYNLHWWTWAQGWLLPPGSHGWGDQQFWPHAVWVLGVPDEQVLDLTSWRYASAGQLDGYSKGDARSVFLHKPNGMAGARAGGHGPMPAGVTQLGIERCNMRSAACALFRRAMHPNGSSRAGV